ncbi:MAG: AbrB/MazE/SpoVT family DNA-binding domain-containing protein [Candidatus Babeliales bacterium]
MMKKKLVKHGNSSALVLDKAILKLLGIAEDAECIITILGNKMVVEPVEVSKKEIAESRGRLIDSLVDEIMDQYSDALAQLAK